MTVADTLNRAADLIETHGLACGQWIDGDRVCAMQAVWAAAGAKGCVSEFSTAVVNGLATLAQHNAYRNAAITLQHAIAPLSIARWSDEYGEAEVVARLRAVAAEQQAELVRLGRG